MLTGGVVAAGEGAHKVIARSELEQSEGVWLMRDEDEARDIAKPLAAMLQRRLGEQAVPADINDLLTLAVALGAYVFHNALKTLQLRRVAKAMRRMGLDPENESTATEGD